MKLKKRVKSLPKNRAKSKEQIKIKKIVQIQTNK